MIIKANQPSTDTAPGQIALEELAVLAGSRDEGLRAEAARIVAEAKNEAEQIRREAAEQGRREGEQAAREQFANEQAEHWSTFVPALEEAVEQIQHARQAWLRHWEKTAVGVAVSIAERVLRRELVHQPDVPVDLAREALELAAGSDRVRVLLSPADHQALADRIESLAGQMGTLGTVEIVPDASISPGGCRVETRFGAIDQQFETQLARIEQELA